MARECYSCAKCMDPDRTCMGDRDCEWWEPIEYDDWFDALFELTVDSMNDSE